MAVSTLKNSALHSNTASTFILVDRHNDSDETSSINLHAVDFIERNKNNIAKN